MRLVKSILPVFLFTVITAPFGVGQVPVNDVAPETGPSLISTSGESRGFGDLLKVVLDLEGLGDSRTLGIEFDGTHYWVTSAFDFTICYLYQILPDGTLVNTFPQPSAHWATWGWRDLADDGTYLYAGTDADHPGEIAQIDKSTGTPTGEYYGPIPQTVARAVAHDPLNDTFFTSNWGIEIYQVARNDQVTIYSSGTTLITYGMAIEAADPGHPMLWLWSQNGTNLLKASEFDYAMPGAPPGSFTGLAFEGVAGHGQLAGGAAAHPGTDGWELIVMAQIPGPEGDVGHYQLWFDGLEADVDEVDGILGGEVNFTLNAGGSHGGRAYALVGSLTGSVPGWKLPGGLVLPVNFDVLTMVTVQMGLSSNPLTPGFMGTLDGLGAAAAKLIVPPNLPIFSDADMTFAFCTIQPFDYVSNAVTVKLLGPVPPPPGYANDDGSAEEAIMWSGAHHNCWMTQYDSNIGDTIESISIAWGWQDGTSSINGNHAELYVYEDPTEDGDPDDAVLLGIIVTTIQQAHTNTFIKEMLGAPVAVAGKFFIAAYTFADSGTKDLPSGCDTSDPTGYYLNESWLCGAGPTWNPANPTEHTAYEMSSLGYPHHWMLRANQR